MTDMQNGQLDSIIEFSEDISTAELPDPLPNGEQVRGSIISATVHVSNTSGKKSAKVVFRVDPSDYPASFPVDNAPDGKNLITYVGLSDDAPSRARLRDFCEAIGYKASTTLNLNDFIGLEALLTIKHEDYQGRTQERLDKISAV